MPELQQSAEPEIATKGLDYLTEMGQTGGSALPSYQPSAGSDTFAVPAGQSRALDDMAATSPLDAPSESTSGWPSVGLPDDVVKGRADIQRAKAGESDAFFSKMDQRLEEDRARIKQAYDATGIGPYDLPKWDYEKQRERTRTNPLESFGSVASIFAMVAAAFTKAPMENALLGSAAAMNAIKANNDEEYNKSFDAWKANTDLALKRHNIMQQNYQNAIQLQTTDMNASRQQLAMLAAKYEDKQLLFLMEHGMDKEAMELLEKRQVMMVNSAKAMETMTKATIQREMLDKDPEFNNEDGDPVKRAARKLNAFDRIYHPATTPEKTLIGQYMYENPHASAEEVAEFRNKYFGFGGRLSAEQAATQQILNADMPDAWKEEALLKLLQQRKQGAGMSAARPGSEAEQVNTLAEQLLKDGKATDRADAIVKARQQLAQATRKEPLISEEIRRRTTNLMKPKEEGGQGLSEKDAFNKAAQDVKRAVTTPSGNRLDDIKRIQGTIELSRSTMNKAETLLNKHFGITGVGGMITRPMEAVGNMTAISNETDRAQFRRFIDEIKEWAPTVLLQRSGRPLAAEAARLDRIIAGLNAGDTAANTKRAFKELRETWGMIEQQLQERATGEPGTPKAAPAAGDGWWKGLKDRTKE